MDLKKKGVKEVENHQDKWNQEANVYLKDESKIQKLLKKAREKAFNKKGILYDLWKDIQLLFSLISDYIRGIYTDIETSVIIKIVIGIIYFVAPIDAIADFLPGIGLVDDIGLLTYIITTFTKELNKYEAWKTSGIIELDDSQ